MAPSTQPLGTWRQKLARGARPAVDPDVWSRRQGNHQSADLRGRSTLYEASIRRTAGKNDPVVWTAVLVLVGIAAWRRVRRSAVDQALRMWRTAVVLLIAGFSSVALAFVAHGGASLGLVYFGAVLIGLSAAIGIPASFSAWRQRDAPIWPPR